LTRHYDTESAPGVNRFSEQSVQCSTGGKRKPVGRFCAAAADLSDRWIPEVPFTQPTDSAASQTTTKAEQKLPYNRKTCPESWYPRVRKRQKEKEVSDEYQIVDATPSHVFGIIL